MRIVRRVFEIADNGKTGPLFHAELDDVLPLHYEVGDIVEELQQLVDKNPDDLIAFEVSGVRSPQSRFVTLKQLSITETEQDKRVSAKRARWAEAAIKERVAAGDLVQVTVSALSDRSRTLGNARALKLFDHEFVSGQCHENAPALVEAMRDDGEAGWELVFGLAFGEIRSCPVAHVWVRKGDLQFDPTWDQPGFRLEEFRYYALSDKHRAIRNLDGVDALAGSWRVCLPAPDLPDFPSSELSQQEQDELLQNLVDAHESRTKEP